MRTALTENLEKILEAKKMHRSHAKENLERQRKSSDTAYEIANAQQKAYSDAGKLLRQLEDDIETLERLVKEYS